MRNANRRGGAIVAIAATVALAAGCGEKANDPAPVSETRSAPPAAEQAAESMSTEQALAAAVAAQPDEVKARYDARHPEETLRFFGIEPGMTVVEALPGGGWYTKILLPLLGPDGTLIGVDYAPDMFRLFGFMSEEQLEAKKTWPEDWVKTAEGWGGDEVASVEAFAFGNRDTSQFTARADAVLMIRALHNLARFEPEGGYLTTALADAYAVLKPGGVLGVVQHEARPEMPDDWASGANGYLKRSFVIDAAEAAGFQFVGASNVNRNDADQPGTDDVVWRLPPTLATSRDDEALRAEMVAVGESNRMTLKFVKPE